MNNRFVVNLMNAGNFSFVPIVILGCAIPFGFNKVSIFMPLLALIIVIAQKFTLENKTLTLWLIAIFVVHLIWSIASFFYLGTGSFFEKTLPLLVFPLAIAWVPINQLQKKQLLNWYVAAVLVSYFLSLAMAVYNYHYGVAKWGRPSDFFFHEQFSNGLFGLHPTYYSLMGCVATIVAFHTLKSWKKALIVVLLTIFIGLLNARITIIIQFLLIAGHLIKGLFHEFHIKRIAYLVLGILIVIVLYKVINDVYDYQHRKIMVSLHDAWERSKQTDLVDGVDGGIVIRMAVWRNSLEVIGQSPLLGAGFGMETPVLVAQYEKNGMVSLAEIQYNAHNQLLSFLISFGILGTLIILIALFVLIRNAIVVDNWIYVEFILVFALCCLTESMLNRLAGVTLFAFFNSLLLLKYRDE